MPEFKFTKHALWRIQHRRISLDEIEKVLSQPDQIIDRAEDEVKIYQSLFYPNEGSPYLLRVFVAGSTRSARIVSVYKTTKIHKYWVGEP